MSPFLEHDTLVSQPAFDTDADVDDDASDAEWLRSKLNSNVGPLHRIVRHLASGGMGHVFLAEHSQLGAHAAVKLPRPGSPSSRAVIAHEAVLLSQLQHPNIVSVLDSGHLADGAPYLLMEYVGGLPLDGWIDSCGAMSPRRAVGILQQVASAVDYLHAQGVVHSDIKPANIIFDPRAHDFVKLIDFGIAYNNGLLEIRRGLVGTPAYMAPEQARGEPCGAAIDVYGVAALALELLTGKPPYESDNAQDLLAAVLSHPPALPSIRGLNVLGLDAVIAKGLHSDPAERYPTAGEFVAALERVFERAEVFNTLGAAQVVRGAQELQAVSARSATDPRADTLKSRSGVCWRAARLAVRPAAASSKGSLASRIARRFAACAFGRLAALRV